MNEAELVAATIATVKRDGWSTGSLFRNSDKTHCILGAIGKARWGNQWDVDCLDSNESKEVYLRLRNDPVTNALVGKVKELLLVQMDREEFYDKTGNDEEILLDDRWTHDVVMEWNDSLLHSEDELLEVLEKVQAEIGVE